MPPDIAPEQPDDDARIGDAGATPTPVPAAPIAPTPVLPTQSREDTDVGWGDYGERDNDDRLLRDRPPHWDDA
jgi:hypothetical protein